MLQIISGKLKGMRIQSPDGKLLRPTKSSVREALFNILGQDLTGYSFMDLCAGTGAIGLEAVSRNAKPVYLVELSRRVGNYLDRNLQELEKRVGEDVATLYLESFLVFGKRGIQADIVYFDPPYELYKEGILKKVDLGKFVNEGGLLIMEYSKSAMRESPEEHGESMVLVKTKKYGTSKLSIYRRKEDLELERETEQLEADGVEDFPESEQD